ncbi:MAG: type II toxin-antitoxin system RelE/ParE family toxin [Thermoanaerobaculia bacterium]|nr:type II toxin-antitoxin system RelE/ParE family toxin [Thermoanaerobaculia bacterium]
MNTPDFEVGLSVRARRDLREIARYYADTVSESVANKNYDRLIEAMESLGTRPERYPPEPLLAQFGNYRVLRLRKLPYEIFYKISGNAVIVVRIIHSKRNLKRIFGRFKP